MDPGAGGGFGGAEDGWGTPVLLTSLVETQHLCGGDSAQGCGAVL